MKFSEKNLTDVLHSAGGLLLALGAMSLYARRISSHHSGDLVLTLLALGPAALLYGIAISGRGASESAHQPWRSVLMVVSVILMPFGLTRLLEWLGATGNVWGVIEFLLIAALATYGARASRSSYTILLSGTALVFAWLGLGSLVLSHLSPNSARVLLIVAGFLLFILATWLGRSAAMGAAEIATIAGLAMVVAGVIGVIAGAFSGVDEVILSAGLHHQGQAEHAKQGLGWNLYLLLASVTCALVAARFRIRGLGYVGGLGLLAFLSSVGTEFVQEGHGEGNESLFMGWPIVLMVGGVVSLFVAVLYARSSPTHE